MPAHGGLVSSEGDPSVGYAGKVHFTAWIVAQNERWFAFLGTADLDDFALRGTVCGCLLYGLGLEGAQSWEPCSCLLCDHEVSLAKRNDAA